MIMETIIFIFFICIVLFVLTMVFSIFLELICNTDIPSFIDKVREWLNKKHSVQKEILNKKEKMNVRFFFDTKYSEILRIRDDFNEEYSIALLLIEKIFPSPQITNDKYIEEVRRVNRTFNKKYDKVVSFMKTYPREDSRSTEIVNSSIITLKSLYCTMKDLNSELSVLSVEVDDVDLDTDFLEKTINDTHNYWRHEDG